MKSLSYERLYYYLARLDELRESHEDIGLRRARADGLITDLLRELAQLLPEDDRILVLAIVGKHDRLWSVSSPRSLPVSGVESSQKLKKQYRAEVLMGFYTEYCDRSPRESGAHEAYHNVAHALWKTRDVDEAGYEVQKDRDFLGRCQKRDTSWQEQQAIYQEFIERYVRGKEDV
jgi:ParB-like chromosome segregation protein Spo0J